MIPAERAISAVPWFALTDLFHRDLPPLHATLDRARRMASSPIVTVNLWFDRPIVDEPLIGLPGRTMQWAFNKGTHLSLVSSGAEAIARKPNDDLIRLAHDELLDAVAPARAATLGRATVVRETHATFSLAPGQPPRPSVETGVNGLLLAGDWTDTGLPATIESAVRSGHAAADLCT